MSGEEERSCKAETGATDDTAARAHEIKG